MEDVRIARVSGRSFGERWFTKWALVASIATETQLGCPKDGLLLCGPGSLHVRSGHFRERLPHEHSSGRSGLHEAGKRLEPQKQGVKWVCYVGTTCRLQLPHARKRSNDARPANFEVT